MGFIEIKAKKGGQACRVSQDGKGGIGKIDRAFSRWVVRFAES